MAVQISRSADLPRTVWYFADPMCSWCWGFMPVIEAIREQYRGRAKIALVPGGLRPGTQEPMSERMREEILHHWHTVHERTGQAFRFEGAMPEGFVYDTEPASRAVVAADGIAPEATFPMYKAVQSAFYAEGRDVTRPEVLTDVAGSLGLDQTNFRQAFESEEARAKTVAHFRHAREWGVRGFPTMILQGAGGYRLLSNGWQPLEELRLELEAWLCDDEETR
jgi:putative protein-disulfide isomerase